jgi:hypothetical protein
MAIFFDAPVSPDALTAFVREVPIPSQLGLSALFPTRMLDTNTVDFAEIVRTNRTARFRSFDGRIHVSERDTGSEKRVSLLPLSSSLSMGEYERLQLEFARTSGTNQQALANAVYNDAENLTREVLNRMEQAWGDVLTDGKLTINENGFVGEADFGVPATQIVSAGTVWTNPAALIFTDIRTWTDVYLDGNGSTTGNGFAPATMKTSTRILRAAQTNTEFINAIKGSAAGASRVSIQEINDLLSGEGLPTFDTAYDTRVDVDGTSTRVIADDKVMFLPPNIEDLGYTAYGLSATALELVNANVADLSFEEAPGIVGVVEKTGPPYRQFTFVDAVGMPILANAKLLMVADVA